RVVHLQATGGSHQSRADNLAVGGDIDLYNGGEAAAVLHQRGRLLPTGVEAVVQHGVVPAEVAFDRATSFSARALSSAHTGSDATGLAVSRGSRLPAAFAAAAGLTAIAFLRAVATLRATSFAGTGGLGSGLGSRLRGSLGRSFRRGLWFWLRRGL